MEVWLCCFIDASLQLLLQQVRVAARGPAGYLRREPFCSQVSPSSSSCLGAGSEERVGAAFLEATPARTASPGPSRSCCCLPCMCTASLSWISLSSFLSRQDALFCRFHPSISSQTDAVSTPSFVFLCLKNVLIGGKFLHNIVLVFFHMTTFSFFHDSYFGKDFQILIPKFLSLYRLAS